MRYKVDIPSCDACPSRWCTIFENLKLEELEVLSQYKCGNLYKKGQNIFFDGRSPNGLYCINSGKVKIYKIDTFGKEQIVRLAKDGNVIGYRSLISGEKYSAFATALVDSLICFIPKDIFFNLLENNADLSFKFMQLLSHDVKTAENFLTTMSQKLVRERVAEVLLILKEFYGVKKDGFTLNVSLKREEIASMVGTATETVIRFLSEFKEDKMIDLEKSKIKIIDQSALVRTANIYD